MPIGRLLYPHLHPTPVVESLQTEEEGAQAVGDLDPLLGTVLEGVRDVDPHRLTADARVTPALLERPRHRLVHLPRDLLGRAHAAEVQLEVGPLGGLDLLHELADLAR